MKKADIFLLEDDNNLSETVSEYLEDEGYHVVCAFSGEEAEEIQYESQFDLLILDVNVPGPNGFDVLKNARSQHLETPAIYMTSLNSMQDVETGYASGGDDYLRKPFELKELLLRVQSILKRNYFHQSNARIVINETLSYDSEQALLYRDDEVLTLHDKEAKLLKLFMQHKNEVLTHEVIAHHLWEFDENPSDDALRTYIKNLRKIIGKEKIESLKRIGYLFRSQ